MSQQTRIDQFFKSVGTKYASNSVNINNNGKSKSLYTKEVYTQNKMEKKSKKACVSLPQHTKEFDTIQDCLIIYEKIHKAYDDTSENDIEIIECKDVSVLEETSQNILDAKCIPCSSSEAVTMTKVNEICLETPTHILKKPRTSNENNVSLTNNNSPPTPMSSRSSSKVASGRSPEAIVRNRPFSEIINEIAIQAIENMNLAQQGAIPLHNFNLEEIYSRSTFNYQYNSINSQTSLKYKVSDIYLCGDLHSQVLLATIFSVFSNPINCGYFDESDLDFIYSIITLPINAQMLLARMIKRKRSWFRSSNIKYPEVEEISDVKDAFNVLVKQSICTFDIKRENLSTILELLQVDEIRHVCQKMKIHFKGNKKNNIQKLLQLSKKKPLFPGVKGPNSSLYASIFDMLGYCVCITSRTWDILYRIIVLLIPNEDPKNTIADIFFKLRKIYLENMIYPNIPGHYFPVFSNKLHLISYIKVKSILSATLQHKEQKDWKKVQSCGDSAMDTLSKLLKSETLRLKHSVLPIHVQRYMPGYVWIKILSTCVDAFKKDKDKNRVVEVLNFLLQQNCYMNEYKGRWYSELALIEMFYNKNDEKLISIVTHALSTETLTQVDKVNLIERVQRIVKKKTAGQSIKRASIDILSSNISEMPKYETATITITAASMSPFRNSAGKKSIWCIENNTEGQSYGSVETVALHHYKQHGFPNGVHCEGALPIILFFTLFWEELYSIHVPGTFVTPYQEAPSDLFTIKFYENRKERIDTKFQIIGNFNAESFASWMQEKFIICKQYQSLMSQNLLYVAQLKEIVHCLGVEGVVGICKRLLENFKLWKAGFPDLIVWNYSTKDCKIVEVKGPGDDFSGKQSLWLEYLEKVGLNTEVCLVQGKYCQFYARTTLDNYNSSKASVTVTVQGPWK